MSERTGLEIAVASGAFALCILVATGICQLIRDVLAEEFSEKKAIDSEPKAKPFHAIQYTSNGGNSHQPRLARRHWKRIHPRNRAKAAKLGNA
jgi:hypothetical protein